MTHRGKLLIITFLSIAIDGCADPFLRTPPTITVHGNEPSKFQLWALDASHTKAEVVARLGEPTWDLGDMIVYTSEKRGCIWGCLFFMPFPMSDSRHSATRIYFDDGDHFQRYETLKNGIVETTND